MTGTDCDLFTHNQSPSYFNHLVISMEYNQLKSAQICPGQPGIRINELQIT
jgi:hypothetical protein